MKIVILTQADPFYLAENIDYLINRMPAHSEVVGCIVSDVSPFGRRESMLRKAKKTYDIFGLRFFLRYMLIYARNIFISKKRVSSILKLHDIPIINTSKNINSDASLQQIQEFQPNLLISIASNQIFKRPLIDLAEKGCLNLHTALLPKYRGLMPTFWTLKNNEKYTGVSVFFVDEGIDSGPILVQKKIEITENTLEDLIKKTKKRGMDAVIEAIDLINSGNYNLIENDATKKSYYSFPTRQQVKEFLQSGKKFY